ncbi:alpha/beta hydrolase [Arenimonas sp.]|uniref:alpha/beta hydrolase n=1 Tax=Arenimonas sp. TaxID=1872635 RepID=UPI0039E7283E
MPYRTILLVAALLLAWLASFAVSGQGLRERWQARRAASGEPSAALPAGARVLRDVAYGSDPAQRYDIYLPGRAANAPVVFMVHGGGWRVGDKTHDKVVDNKIGRWLPKGFVLISANYRMLPTQDALGQAEDVARALAHAQKHAREWGGDPRRFVLMGHSAGAHLVALISADPARYSPFGVAPTLGTVSLDSGAIDVVAKMQTRHLPLYDAAFGDDPSRWRLASPTHALVRGAAPLLAVCSSERRDQPCNEAKNYLARAHSLGVRAELLPQAKTHAEINQQLGLPGAYTDAVERFLASLDDGIAALLR